MHGNIRILRHISGTILTVRSLITAVICDPSAPLLISSSHCVVITRAGASARVKSATNTISGLRTVTFISVFETTAGAAVHRSREQHRKNISSDHNNLNLIDLILLKLYPQLTYIYKKKKWLCYQRHNKIGTLNNKCVSSPVSFDATEELMFFFSTVPGLLFGCGP